MTTRRNPFIDQFRFRSIHGELLLAIVGAGVGCAGASDGANADPAAPESIRLKLDTVSDAPVLGQLTAVTLAGSTLWVADRAGNPALHAIDTTSRAILRSVGRPGSGPSDIPRASSISVDAADSTAIWVAGLGKLTRIDEMSFSPNANGHLRSFSYRNTGALWAYSIAGGHFVGNAFRDTATIVVFDSAGRVLSALDISPPGTSDVSLPERLRAFQGSVLCVGKSGTMLALTYRSEARVDFFSSALKRTGSAKVPFPYQARFDTTSVPRPAFLARRDSGYTGKVFVEGRQNYGGCSFSDNHLFALYSGRTPSLEPTGTESCCGSFIHVFDFNGELVQVLDLGVNVVAIVVTHNEDRIFATSEWTSSMVYRFSIPRLSPR